MLRFYFVCEKIVSIDMPNDYLATIALIILLRGNKDVKPMEISWLSVDKKLYYIILKLSHDVWNVIEIKLNIIETGPFLFYVYYY